MDSKYVRKTIALPNDAHDAVEKLREELTRRWGFKPSLSETITFAVKYWQDKNSPTDV